MEAVEKWTPGGGAPFPTPESEDALTELKRHTSTTRFQVYIFTLRIPHLMGISLLLYSISPLIRIRLKMLI